MANEVEITITSQDKSSRGFNTARTRAKAFATEITAIFAKAGGEAGQAMGDSVVDGAERSMQAGRSRLARGGQDLGDAISDGVKKGTDRGSKIVDGFASSALQSFGRLGPGMSAVILAGVAAAPAAAAVAAGGVALAAGGAITAIGLVSAAQSVRVRREWSETGREVKSSLADAAQPMEDSAIRAAGVVRSTFGRLKPFLSGFFQDSQPAVDRFVKSIGNGIASLGPALQPLQRGYSAVLNAISNRSPAIFGSLERSLENLGETAEEHGDDIAAAFEFAASAVEKTTEAVDFLADEWGKFVADVEAADQASEDFGTGLRETLYEWARALGIDTEQMRETEASWQAVDRATSQTGGVDAAKSATGNLAGSAKDAAAGMRDLAEEFEALTGPALDAAEAQIRVEEAIDQATESVRKNGRTLDVNTEKGRANREALIDIARAAQQHVAAMQAEGASTDSIASAYTRYRGQLVRTLRQAGATRAEARRLADAWLGMPESVTTAVKGNVGDLKRKIADAKARLKDPKLTRPEAARIRAEISDLQRKVAAAKAALASVKSKSVSIFINQIYRSSGIGVGSVLAPQAHGGIIGGIGSRRFAQGGVSGSGSSLAMVGEQGPELVRLPFGSTVTPAGGTRAAMAQSGFGSISMAFRSAGQSGGLGGAGGLRDSLKEIISFREALEKLSSTLIGQTRAVSAYEAAWDAAGKSLKENGKRLSLTTERGRENRGALMDLAEAAREVIIAMHEQGRSTNTLIDRMKEQRSQFVSMARRMGLSKKDASAMADRVGLTTAGVRSALAASAGKASGGVAGGMTLVGERGPELVRLPFGSSVTPAGQTAAIMTGGGGERPIHIMLQIGTTALGEIIIDPLRKAVRTRGGNVQAVLGRS